MVIKKDFLEDIRKLVRSKIYKARAVRILEGTEYRISRELHEAELGYAAGMIQASELDFARVAEFVSAESNARLEVFCRTYMRAEAFLDQGQEYNPAEPPERDELSDEEYDGHSQTFLIQFATLMLVLEEQQEHLAAFLKKIRAPHAAKRAAALRRFFDGFQRNNDS
ncbi:hypothetical protein BH11PSE8_BH11PSE8_34020 [soil metagenome]